MAKIDSSLPVSKLTYNGTELTLKGGSTPTPYVRPTDWLAIPTMDSTKDEICILNGVGLNCLNKIYFKISGSGTIDWGDGNVESFSSANRQQFEHTFDYNTISESSYTTHNNTKQVLIHITADRGAITYFSTGGITYNHTNADGRTVTYSPSASTDIYEINANVESCEVHCCTNNGQKHRNLEVFDWKGAITTTDMGYMFWTCNSLQSIPQLDAHNVTNTRAMFQNCSSLQAIPQLDTHNVTTMMEMFSNCSSLHSIPQLDTSKVIYMTSMFSNCSSLQSIPQLDTSSTTDMNSMFNACSSLQIVPQLDTSEATNIGYMFYNCSSLQAIPQLDTNNVTTMFSMFGSCYSLHSIPQLDTNKVINMQSMFSNCYSLTNPKLYNAGASSQTSIIIQGLSSSTFMTKQQLIDLFNSVCPNSVSGNTRTLQLGSTLQGYLADCYVKDSGEIYTAILPTQDTEVDSTKTYYTYNKVTGEYTQFTGTSFETGTFYYELKTATWNRFDICDSADANAKLALTWFTGTDTASGEKGWTVS